MKQLRWVVLGALVASSFAYGQLNSPSKLVGKKIPSFSMKTYVGKNISDKSLKGKAYVLDFWASWCGPCKAASPTMQMLHDKYKSKGLVVVGANVFEDDDAGKKEAKAYPKAKKYTYTFTTGGDSFAQKIGAEGIPLFIFVGKDGKVKAVETGFDGSSSPAQFEKYVKSIL